MLSMPPWFMARMASNLHNTSNKKHAAKSVIIDWQKDFCATLNWPKKHFPPCWIEKQHFPIIDGTIVKKSNGIRVYFAFGLHSIFSRIKVFNWMFKPSKKDPKLLTWCGLHTSKLFWVQSICCWMVEFWIERFESFHFQCNSIGVCPLTRYCLCCAWVCVCQCVIKRFEPNKFSLRFSIYYWNLL